MATGRTIVEDALLEIGVGADGESTDQGIVNHALRVLNRMWQSWAAKVKPIYSSTLDSHTWPASTQSQTIGSGGDINTVRPILITGVQSRLNNRDYSLDQVSYEQFQNITYKTLESNFPDVFAYQKEYPLGVIYLNPVPAQALTIRITSKKAMTAFTLSGTLSLPEGYEEALVANLAQRLSNTHGKGVRPQLKLDARNSLRRIENINTNDTEMWPDPLVPGYGYSDDINLYTNK